MKLFIIIKLSLLFTIVGNCQILKRDILNQNDKVNGIFQRFTYDAKGSYGSIVLTLKRNKTYQYTINSFAYHGISEGTWQILNRMLILQSTFQLDNIPVEISYGNEGDFVDSFDIAIVRNIKHEPLTEAFVLVNNDSVRCLPVIGKCNATFDKINRVKVTFENGMSSKWIPIKDGEKKITPIVLSDIPIGNYIIMSKQKFRIDGSRLISL